MVFDHKDHPLHTQTTFISLKRILSLVLHKAASIPVVARIAVKTRNQCNLLIGRYLGDGGTHSPCGEKLVLSHLAKHCRGFVDVGANIGEWSEAFLEFNPKIPGLLVEPSTECQNSLAARFSNKNLKIVDCAVSDFDGTSSFCQQEFAGERSSLAETYVWSDPYTLRHIKVFRLDTLLQAEGFDTPDFVKIDAEGVDGLAILGAAKLLERKSIKFLQFEYNIHWVDAGITLKRIRTYLEEAGYRVFLIRHDGLYDLDFHYWGEFFFHSNFLACSHDTETQLKCLLRGSM